MQEVAISRREFVGTGVALAALTPPALAEKPQTIDIDFVLSVAQRALACTENVFPARHHVQFYDLSPVIQLGIELARLEAVLPAVAGKTGVGTGFLNLISARQVTEFSRYKADWDASIKTPIVDGKQLRQVLTSLVRELQDLTIIPHRSEL